MKFFALACLVSAGCVDAKGSFEHYGERVVDADTRDIDAPIVSTLPDITGEFYMVARPDLPEDRFVHFRCTYTFHVVTANTGTLDWSGQALDYTTLEPVGEPFTATAVPVGSDGVADVPMTGTLDHRANSISNSNAAVDAVVHTQLVSTDFICGTLTGTAGPLPLEGTTFGGRRIVDATLPPMAISCADGP
jgi:hypothetical protein